MNQKQLQYALQILTMPEEMKESLKESTSVKRKFTDKFVRYPKTAVAALIGVVLLATGSTSYAAYHVYQMKNLRIFFEVNATDEQIYNAGEKLRQIEGVSEVEFVSADQAWEEFKAEYFGEQDIAELGEENPLKESFNYKVSVQLSADTKAVRESIEHIDGVRMVSDLSELKEEGTGNF